MAEEKKEPWLNYLALTTVILAVCATFSTFKGGGYSTLSVLSQNLASDQWAYYQAKSIKGYLYELQKERFEMELKTQKAPGLAKEYGNKIKYYTEKIEKYENEKDGIKKKAEEFEHIRDDARIHGKEFGKAINFLQIAILLSSIAALMKKKPLWAAGMAVGAVGVVYFLNGFFLFVK